MGGKQTSRNSFLTALGRGAAFVGMRFSLKKRCQRDFAGESFQSASYYVGQPFGLPTVVGGDAQRLVCPAGGHAREQGKRAFAGSIWRILCRASAGGGYQRQGQCVSVEL